jgi:hypothetical protein
MSDGLDGGAYMNGLIVKDESGRSICDCPADKMPFGRCCKAALPVEQPVAWSVRDAHRRFVTEQAHRAAEYAALGQTVVPLYAHPSAPAQDVVRELRARVAELERGKHWLKDLPFFREQIANAKIQTPYGEGLPAPWSFLSTACDCVDALANRVAELEAQVAAQQVAVPDEVMRALDRMCTPLDDSWLGRTSVTAQEDVRCMKVIHDYILGSAVKDSLTTDERKSAEHAYTVSAFDYEKAPVGSRDWTLFLSGWQKCAAQKSHPPCGADGAVPDGDLIRQAIARAWCNPLNAQKVMDPDIAEAAAAEVMHLLTTRPSAPAQDVVRDAERYRFLKTRSHFGNRVPHIEQYPYQQTIDRVEFPHFTIVGIDAAIDAALLAASKQQEGE